jgi:hypothetical protein
MRAVRGGGESSDSRRPMTGHRPPVRAFREHFLSPVADHLRTNAAKVRTPSGAKPAVKPRWPRPDRQGPPRGIIPAAGSIIGNDAG